MMLGMWSSKVSRFSALEPRRSEFLRVVSSYCTSKDTDAPELRKLMRKFYLKVHPDLFADFPKERAVNQNSLKELTSFTEEWCKNTAQSNFVPKKQQKIQFYVKKKQTVDQELPEASASSQDSNADKFSIHTMTLISNGSFSEVQGQYSKLFAQVSDHSLLRCS